jgi:cysteine-rich repeat protein
VQIDPNHFRIVGFAASPGGGGSSSGGNAGSAGATGGSGGASGSNAGSGGALSALLTCNLNTPTGSPPATSVCGDGFRTGAEACDDNNLLAGDACSPTCQITPQKIW